MSLIIDTYALNEKSATIVFGNEISLALANTIARFDRALKAKPFPGLITTVPAYASLTVWYDPLVVRTAALTGRSNFDKVAEYLKTLKVTDGGAAANVRQFNLPVCYEGEFAPDLEEVARHAKLDADEVVNIHSSATYIVYMIGFVPGFAYLGGMDVRLSSPRKKSPRAVVPAGSVGIAGEQTGIYPLATPGGWQLIGRTAPVLFDLSRADAALLRAGDEINFHPVSAAEFKSLF